MDALIVVDAQNEFTDGGHRPVPGHLSAFAAIRARVTEARAAGWPIAWIRHHNPPQDGPAFQPGTWGAEFGPGLAREEERDEAVFEKQVFGAFTGTGLDQWLGDRGIRRVTLVGFYVHMCLSTTAREALVRGLDVTIDPDATGGCDLADTRLGSLTAEEVRRSALLQLIHMGVRLTPAARTAAAA